VITEGLGFEFVLVILSMLLLFTTVCLAVFVFWHERKAKKSEPTTEGPTT